MDVLLTVDGLTLVLGLHVPLNVGEEPRLEDEAAQIRPQPMEEQNVRGLIVRVKLVTLEAALATVEETPAIKERSAT